MAETGTRESAISCLSASPFPCVFDGQEKPAAHGHSPSCIFSVVLQPHTVLEVKLLVAFVKSHMLQIPSYLHSSAHWHT